MTGFADIAHEIVVTSSDILFGMPVIAGTRIPACDVMALIAGAKEEELLADYPSLKTHHLQLIATYAKMNLNGSSNVQLTRALPEGLIRAFSSIGHCRLRRRRPPFVRSSNGASMEKLPHQHQPVRNLMAIDTKEGGRRTPFTQKRCCQKFVWWGDWDDETASSASFVEGVEDWLRSKLPTESAWTEIG